MHYRLQNILFWYDFYSFIENKKKKKNNKTMGVKKANCSILL